LIFSSIYAFNMSKMGKQRVAWTREDDEKLVKIYLRTKFPTGADFKEFFPNRHRKQCVERYNNHVETSIKEKRPLTKKQIKQILYFRKIWGNKWTKIGKEMSLAPNTIKNFWHAEKRKKSQTNVIGEDDEYFPPCTFKTPVAFEHLCQVASEEWLFLENYRNY